MILYPINLFKLIITHPLLKSTKMDKLKLFTLCLSNDLLLIGSQSVLKWEYSIYIAPVQVSSRVLRVYILSILSHVFYVIFSNISHFNRWNIK